jgi:hypothetical protein
VLSGVERCVGTWSAVGDSRGYGFGRCTLFGSGSQSVGGAGQCSVHVQSARVHHTSAVLSGVERCVGTWSAVGNSRGYGFGRCTLFGSGRQSVGGAGHCSVHVQSARVHHTSAVLSGLGGGTVQEAEVLQRFVPR